MVVYNLYHLHLLLMNLFFILSLPFISLLVFSDLEADRAALLRLRDSVRGTTLRWNITDTTTDSSLCQWDGVRCDAILNRVTELRLPGDRLSGQLPENTIGNLTRLRVLSLRHNSLSGPIPSDLGLCTDLININLEGNRFSGDIPDSLFQLSNLERLNLARNEFSGQISSGFNSLRRLRTLFLQNNRFNGSLPQLNSLSDLQLFNVSFNNLNGSIPERLNGFPSNSFLNNSLCGGPLPSCPETDQSNDGGSNNLSAGAIAGIVLGSIIGLILILLIILFIVRKKCRIQKQPGKKQTAMLSPLPPPSPVKYPPGHDFKIPKPHLIVRENSKGMMKERKVNNNGGEGGLVFFGDKKHDQLFSLDELLRASAEVLGKGVLGTTYRAYLETGEDVVVKRLRNVCVSEGEFRKRIEILGLLNHKNLVPLKAYFFGKDERLIVYESFPTNLHSILHGAERPSLTWIIRCRIASGIAHGLEYLHSLELGSNTLITTHGSIKSSNIMLNRNYDPSVSEYCITSLVSSSVVSNSSLHKHNNKTATSTYGGYGAPEVIYDDNDIPIPNKVSQKADVYSFGVLLLELLTGKDPQITISMESEETNYMHLPKWVRSVVQERWTIQVFDNELLKRNNNYEEQMVQLLHLAIACTSRLPEKRPSMKEVVVRINGICGPHLPIPSDVQV